MDVARCSCGGLGRGWVTLLRGPTHYSQLRPFNLLEVRDDLEQVLCLGIALLTKHSHQRFGRPVQILPQLDETNCAVNVLAQNGLSYLHFA